MWARSFTSLPAGNMVDGLSPVHSWDIDVIFDMIRKVLFRKLYSNTGAVVIVGPEN